MSTNKPFEGPNSQFEKKFLDHDYASRLKNLCKSQKGSGEMSTFNISLTPN